MAEMRRDPINGRWVIVATDEESWAPDAYDKEKHQRHQAEVCQFCPGRERLTPPEVDAFRPDGSGANAAGWRARVVPNKFPALRIEGNLDRRAEGLYDRSNGVGAHEVLIETPDHNRDLADLYAEDITHVLRLCQNRANSLGRDRRFKYIMIFKNYGELAGASVEHAHTQIIALPMVPRNVQGELEGAAAYFKFRGRCVYCDMLEQEYGDKKGIITDNESFVALCPFAPRYPFEVWILPRGHTSQFSSLNDHDRFQLARILKEVLVRMKTALADPSYNYYLHFAPVNYGDLPSYHWHVELVPQLVRVAGFEWGTGFHVVRTSPAMAAEHLRAVKYKP